MKKVFIAMVLILTGCTTGIDSSAKTCPNLKAANNMLAEMDKELSKQYDEEYFESDSYKLFVDSFWDGFWTEHKHCKICKENGDIPN